MSSRMRSTYLSIGEIAPNMVLAKPLAVTERRMLRYVLPEGHALTEDNIRQLVSHHAEIICVRLPDERTETQIAADLNNLESRLGKIFETCDLSQPGMAAFFNRVRSYLGR